MLGSDRPIAEVAAEHDIFLTGAQAMSLAQRADREHGDAAIGDRVHDIPGGGEQRFPRQIFRQVDLLPQREIVGVVDAEDRRAGERGLHGRRCGAYGRCCSLDHPGGNLRVNSVGPGIERVAAYVQ